MENWIIAGIILIILAAVITYIVKAKKKGAKCIGCPSGSCCSNNKCDCSCCEKTMNN